MKPSFIFLRIVSLLLLGIAVLSTKTNAIIKSGLCDPYYASIKSSSANLHVGPGKDYKILFRYIQKGIPVIVTAKYDNWRKIKDPEGTEGWLHKSLLSPKRCVMTKNNDATPLMNEANDSSMVVAKIKRNVIMELVSINGNWCKIKLNYNGKNFVCWIKRDTVFGISDREA